MTSMSLEATVDFVHQIGASTSQLIRIGIHSYDPGSVQVTRQNLANSGKTLEIFIFSMAIITNLKDLFPPWTSASTSWPWGPLQVSRRTNPSGSRQQVATPAPRLEVPWGEGTCSICQPCLRHALTTAGALVDVMFISCRATSEIPAVWASSKQAIGVSGANVLEGPGCEASPTLRARCPLRVAQTPSATLQSPAATLRHVCQICFLRLTRCLAAAWMGGANRDGQVTCRNRSATPLALVSGILQNFTRFACVNCDTNCRTSYVMRAGPSSFLEFSYPVFPTLFDHGLRSLNCSDSKTLPRDSGNLTPGMHFLQVVFAFVRAARWWRSLGNFEIAQWARPPNLCLTAIIFGWH